MTTFRRFVYLALALGVLVHPDTTWAQDNRSRGRADAPIDVRKTRGTGADGRFYSDRERGWYWFEEDPDAHKRDLDPPRMPPPPGSEAPGESNAHPPFSVEWLRLELEASRVRAIDDPTRENIEYYAYLEKVAMDKAERFAIMRQQVAAINPGLDETIDNPVTSLARTARRDAQESEQASILRDLASKVGIYYFYKSDCPYCAKQNLPLTEIANRYGFAVLPISIDARPMPDGSFPEWVADAGQAQTLGIESTPTLYLVRPPEEVTVLSVGVQTLPALEKRILQVSRANEWIDEATFERAMRGLPRRFLVDAIEDLQGVDWTDKSQALEAMRYASRRGVERTTMDALEMGASQIQLPLRQ